VSTQADELDHIVHYISIFIEITEGGLNRKLDRLERIKDQGGFLGPGTTECTKLRMAAAQLRTMAERVDTCRQHLESNAKERV